MHSRDAEDTGRDAEDAGRDAGDPVRDAEDAGRDAERVARTAREHGFTVAVAESLTSGKIASTLGAAPGSSGWLRGGVVAYASEVKQKLFGVAPGPVVTEDCARAMARGVAALLDADVAVAVTGVGGPEPSEGKRPGTTWFAVVSPHCDAVELAELDGDPGTIVEATTARALRLLATEVERCAQERS